VKTESVAPSPTPESDTRGSVAAPSSNAQPDLSWDAKGIVLGGGILLAVAYGALLPVLPQMEAVLAHGPRDQFLIKQLFGVIGLSIAISAPIAGYFIDRFGSRPILLVACSVYCLAGTAGLVIDSVPLLVFSRFLVGAAAAAIDTTSVAIINKRLGGNPRAKWNGLHVSVSLLCSIILSPLVGSLAGRFGWRTPFALYVLALPLLLVALRLRDQFPPHDVAVTSRQQPRWWQWFPVEYLAVAVLAGIMLYLPVIYGPFLLRERGISSPVSISLVLMGTSVFGAVMAALYGPCKRILSTNGAFVFSFTVVCVGTLIAGFSPGQTGPVAGLLVTGIGIAWVTPNLLLAVAERVEDGRQGRAAGVVRTMHEVAAPACIVLIEPVTKRYGAAGAMVGAAVLAFVLAAIFIFRVGLSFTVRAREHAQRCRTR
jgi:MFS family permease